MQQDLRVKSVCLGALALAAACTVHNPDAPPLTGPSAFALSMTVTSKPDILRQDGASPSTITVTVRDQKGAPVPGVTVFLEILAGGQLFDFGTLSQRTITTGGDGTALASYIAPPPPPANLGGAGSRVTILATGPTSPQVGNFQATQTQTTDIRLFPPGIIIPSADTPTPLFTMSPTPVNLGVPTRFDASKSCPGPADSTGRCLNTGGSTAIVNYAWNLGDGATGTGVTTTHTFALAQTYNVTLTVTNDRGISNSLTIPVQVGATTGLTAAFTFSPTTPVVGQLVVFNADLSHTTPGHTITLYSWNLGDGTTFNQSSFIISHSYAVQGTYNVTLTVTDDTGQRNTTSSAVPVGSANPVVNFTFSPQSPNSAATLPPGDTVNFDASASTAAPGASIVSWSWNFGDGTTSTSGPTVSKPPYALAGTYTVRLTVTDNATPPRTGTGSAQITVK